MLGDIEIVITMEENKLSVEDKMYLITRGLCETIAMDEVKEKLDRGDQLTCYLGMEPTRSPSLGYLIPMMKLRDLILADLNVIVFLADVHAFLNKGQDVINRTFDRTKYYKFIIEELLKLVGVERVIKLSEDNTVETYTFVCGSDVQLSKKYTLDLLKASTLINVSQALKAGSEVVKQDKNPKLSNAIYPLMQVLDETALEADIQLGGLDQRKIFAMSRDIVEKLGFNKCAYLMGNLLPSLSKPGTKMSSSDLNGKIDFFDTTEDIIKKIKKAYCVEKETDLDKSPCLALAKYIVFPMGGKLGDYTTYEMLVDAWGTGVLDVVNFKAMLAAAVDKIVAPVRNAISENQALFNAAFD
jgi:tyrosyl-tRNA synthetase